ncbi:3-hydroxyacyl-CoA dehydrogenase family protein [Nonomuraea ferruginea]
MTRVAGMTVAVAGLGPMGRGIARVFDRAGARVVVCDVSPEATEAGLALIRREAEADGEKATVEAGTLRSALREATLFAEAVAENMEAKAALLAEVRAHGRDDLVVASNTSSLSVGEMGKAFGDPSRVIGLHFFNPPTKMRLVEVIKAAATADEVHENALGIVRELGKTPVTCADSPNFVVNRVCQPLYYEAQLLVMQGLEPAVVDAVARGALGHRMGPLELLDFTGLHTHLASSETAHREFGDPSIPPHPPWSAGWCATG